MKVLVVTDVFPNVIQPNLGTFSWERVNALRRRIEIKVIAPVPYFPSLQSFSVFKRWHEFSKIPRHENRFGIDVYHPRRIVVPKVGKMASGFFYAVSLKRVIKEIRLNYCFDLIDAHFIWPDAYAAVKAARSIGVPICATAHGTDINYMPKYRSIRKQIIETLKGANRVIAVSKALADIIISLGISSDKIKVIQNGVDLCKFKVIDKTEAKISIGCRASENIIISVGALIPRKGHDFLIDAFKILLSKNNITDLKLLIIGEGPSRSRLLKKIKSADLGNKILLKGQVAHGELYKWYNAADLFCLTSCREGWPTVFFEAWACGLPVVATAVHGVAEAIKDNRYGMLVNKQDASEIAITIEEALNRKWNREEIVSYAKDNTWDSIADKIMTQFYEAILNYEEKYRS